MPQYAALNASNENTAIYIVDEAGRAVWRGKRASDPGALAAALRQHAPDLERVGLETGRVRSTLKTFGRSCQVKRLY